MIADTPLFGRRFEVRARDRAVYAETSHGKLIHLRRQALEELVPQLAKWLEGDGDRLDGASTSPKRRTARRIGGCQEPTIELAEAHIDVKECASEPQSNHAGHLVPQKYYTGPWQ